MTGTLSQIMFYLFRNYIVGFNPTKNTIKIYQDIAAAIYISPYICRTKFVPNGRRQGAFATYLHTNLTIR